MKDNYKWLKGIFITRNTDAIEAKVKEFPDNVEIANKKKKYDLKLRGDVWIVEHIRSYIIGLVDKFYYDGGAINTYTMKTREELLWFINSE